MKKETAKALLKIGAVTLRPERPFTWASGIKSPIYCDNRLVLSDHAARTAVKKAMAELIKEKYPDCEALMGTSTGGIGHAALAADLLALPMGYVRGGAKEHGKGNKIEGRLEPGWKVVVVEDLISTGGSVLDVVETLRGAGAEVLGVAAIFTYGMKKGTENFKNAGCRAETLTDFDTLAEVAAEEGYIAEADIARLRAFRDNPEDGSWAE